MNVYRDLLRERWNDVSPKVRNSHLSGNSLHATCRLDVAGSSHVIGKIVSRIVSLPPAMDAANVDLHIRESAEGELWERMFPGSNLRSVQSESQDGYLVDRFGIIAFSFRLEVSNGGIIHHHVKTHLKLGFLILRLPRFISPRVDSREEPDRDEHASRIHVSLSMPVIGHLLTYDGIVRPVKEEA